ncbi:MAG: hypothetical protein ACK5WT_15235 [Betaproteobacteria bacterium]
MAVSKKSAPSWGDVKPKLAEFDRAGLVGLVQNLYAASKDKKVFLRAGFELCDDVLKPYKATIDRWLWPDAFKQQDTSVAKAKKAIADCKKAVCRPAVRRFGHNLGYGVGDDMDELLADLRFDG